MAHTYTNLLVHGIFSTKDRVPTIEADVKAEMLPVIGGIISNIKGKAYAINGMAAHLHILMSIPPSLSVAEAIQKIKANSSRWVHEKWPKRRAFAWQIGYAAFSVSKSNVPSVIKYIDTQEEHHRKITFQEELIGFLRKHDVGYDERYIWD
jgi:putative transposase